MNQNMRSLAPTILVVLFAITDFLRADPPPMNPSVFTASGGPSSPAQGGFHSLPAGEYLTTADRPFDLTGTTLLFTPISPGRYLLTQTPLQYDNAGSLNHRFDVGPDKFVKYSLTNFSFPFAGSNRSDLYVYVGGGVFFEPPPAITAGPITESSLVGFKQAVIAPLLLPPLPGTGVTPSTGSDPWLYVLETSDAVTFTWNNDPHGNSPVSAAYSRLAIQLQLRKDGAIRFSYKNTGEISWGAVGLLAGIESVVPISVNLSDLAASGVTAALPILEVFKVATLDHAAVWRDLKVQYWYRDEDIDAVAIYQDFYTDLVYHAAGISIGGNAAADGTGIGAGTHFPKSPSLLLMGNIVANRIGEPNYRLVFHEIGHRWLYFYKYIADGVVKQQNGHPSFNMDTTAAFLKSKGSHSILGGDAWTDNGDGTFTRHVVYGSSGYSGYSWHELYLMGLAAREEVQPWFYVESPVFVSSVVSNEGESHVYRGIRRSLDVASIIAASGARVPTYATSQKGFRIILVLISRDPGNLRPDVVQRLRELRAVAASKFVVVTGGRATLEFLPALPPRRRSVRH